MTHPDAVLFDCDGTLVDSETVTTAAMRAALAEQGHELTDEHLAQMVGHPWPRTRALFAELYGMDEDDLRAYEARMRSGDGIVLDDPELVFDDVLAVLDDLAEAQVPVAVVTSSGRSHLDKVLDLAPLRGRFEVRVAREDVEEHKPSPVPYLSALEQLRAATGLDLRQVTVVEDSGPGVAAGRAAGCWTVAVDRGDGLHDLSLADRIVTHLRTADLNP